MLSHEYESLKKVIFMIVIWTLNDTELIKVETFLIKKIAAWQQLHQEKQVNYEIIWSPVAE